MSLQSNSKIFFGKAFILLLVVSAALLFQGCYSKSLVTKAGSHQIKVEREGFVKRFGVTERGTSAIFNYEGYCTTGKYMKVVVNNDEVFFNDKSVGRLREGDSLTVREGGLVVNQMDYADSEKYLKENAKQATASL